MIATKKNKNRFEIYIQFCVRTMNFYKKVEIFFKYSDFGQGQSTLIDSAWVVIVPGQKKCIKEKEKNADSTTLQYSLFVFTD